MKKIAPAVTVFVILAMPIVAFAAANTLKDLAAMIVDLLNKATGVLVAAALVMFLYGAAYNMLRAGERGSAALSTFLVWGVIILFVMVSIWGILNLLQNTLFGSGADGSGSGASAPVGTNNNVNFGN